MAVVAVTVSGSFHRHMPEIKDAVHQLESLGVAVLSPADPTVVAAVGPFLFVASDLHRSVRLVQDRHLAAVATSDFLLLVCPDGYVGQSASLEVGFALAKRIPVFCTSWPDDLTLRQYVQKVDSITEAVVLFPNVVSTAEGRPSLLLDPDGTLEIAHTKIDELKHALTTASDSRQAEIADQIESIRRQLVSLLNVPTAAFRSHHEG